MPASILMTYKNIYRDFHHLNKQAQLSLPITVTLIKIINTPIAHHGAFAHT